MAEALTKIERRILDYIIDYLKKNTYQPSIREIGKRFSIKSTKTVSEHLHSLAEKGCIERDASRSRGVRILGLDLAPEVLNLPVYGQIAAGQPALLREHVSAEFSLDKKLLGSEDAFLLRVMGDSMEGMGIMDGDMVIVEPIEGEEPRHGDIIAARLGGQATVKRYFSKDGSVVLEPANPDYAPILVHEYEDFAVLGKVVGLFRRFSEEQTAAIGA